MIREYKGGNVPEVDLEGRDLPSQSKIQVKYGGKTPIP
jgi:hypothetical protein